MPRVSSGPHLWLDEARDKWTIIDGKRQKRTGFTKGDARKAQQTLADYIGAKHVVSNGPEPPLADVLAVYLREHNRQKVSQLYQLRNKATHGSSLKDADCTKNLQLMADCSGIYRQLLRGFFDLGVKPDWSVLELRPRGNTES